MSKSEENYEAACARSRAAMEELRRICEEQDREERLANEAADREQEAAIVPIPPPPPPAELWAIWSERYGCYLGDGDGRPCIAAYPTREQASEATWGSFDQVIRVGVAAPDRNDAEDLGPFGTRQEAAKAVLDSLEVEPDDAAEALRTAREWIERARAALAKHQWDGCPFNPSVEFYRTCLECHRRSDVGHAANCELKLLIDQAEANT